MKSSYTSNVAGVRELIQRMERVDHSQTVQKTFDTFLEIFSLCLLLDTESKDRDKRIERLNELKRAAGPERYQEYEDLMVTAAELIAKNFRNGQNPDILGEIYMSIGCGNSRLGQYFTPFGIARMMAMMNLGPDGGKEVLAKKDVVTLNEPTCGSGIMVLAFAQLLMEKSIRYQEKLKVTAADLSATCARMAYIQMSILGIDAVVSRGDTLTLEMYETYPTPMHMIMSMLRETSLPETA